MQAVVKRSRKQRVTKVSKNSLKNTTNLDRANDMKIIALSDSCGPLKSSTVAE
jgi:hypothetical protein